MHPLVFNIMYMRFIHVIVSEVHLKKKVYFMLYGGPLYEYTIVYPFYC